MTGYIDQVRADVLAWLDSIRYRDQGWGRWPYHARMERPWALIGSTQAIQIMHRLDALERITDAQRSEAIAHFRACQDPADGRFKDPLVGEAEHQGPHSWDQIHGQMSGAENALRLLGGEPAHPLPQVRFADLRREDPAAFTRRIDWTNPWGHGESWSRAIRCYLDRAEDRAAAIAHLEPAFATFEAEILDPATGYPARGMERDEAPRAMAGLFKCMMAYLDTGRPVPHAERAIDRTLALQHADGEFEFRGNMCINWDALWVLFHLDRQLEHDYRFDDIRAAGERCARFLLAHYRREDGGFAFHGDRCIANHHSVRLSPRSYPISDTIGTKMCLKCLEYADEWNALAAERAATA